MSRLTKKPAEQISSKVKNVNLLPSVMATEPNKKMLDSTLDIMTSKGQMLPFAQTYGIRSASNKVTDFFEVEQDEVRRESQSNNMLVLKDSADSYLGKVSYLDIDNYFNVKNNPIVDGIVLDKNINILDLPINPYRISDYNLFYWLPRDLPACRIHLEPKLDNTAKFSITEDLIGKTFVTLVDDLTGKSLNLQTGMVIYFTGKLPTQDAKYLTVDDTAPKTFFVYNVGDFINLIETTKIETRVPLSYLKKRLWDQNHPAIEPPAVTWGSENWDGSFLNVEPEYVTQEKYSSNANPWQTADHWYHITTIRAVAKFLDLNPEDIATPNNRAKRPIITVRSGIKLYNWPETNKGNIKSLLSFSMTKYQGSINIVDSTGYKIQNGDLVVFEENAGIYLVAGIGSSASFTLVIGVNENDGATIVNNNKFLFHKILFKNGRWILAQNKTEKNQTPLYEFYTGKNQSLESLNNTNFKGGAILGFKDGDVYDPILDKNIEVSKIDFDLIDELSSGSVSPNQLRFYTDVDNSWNYTDLFSGEIVTIQGPYGYRSDSNIFAFYQPRRGLDITKQVQDIIYETESERLWTSAIKPPASTLDTIHVYFQPGENLIFYTEIEGYGLVKLSSKRGTNRVEPLLPLKSGKEILIVCHDLPRPLTFYKTAIIDNITTPIELTAPYCVNNGITDGIIYLNLNDSISLDGGASYIDNEIAKEDTILYWSNSTISGTSTKLYKTALVKPETKWRFLQTAYLKDKTAPIYNEYDYTLTNQVLPDGKFSGLEEIKATSSLLNKVTEGDKIIVNSIVTDPVQKTAPLSLTTNPLNKKLTDINYYSLYQHTVDLKSNSTNSKEYNQSESLQSSSLLGGGTFLKHSSPISKFAVMATNMPYDLGDLLIKQGKHYDIFLNKLKTELETVVNNNNYAQMTSYDLLSMALDKIFLTRPSDSVFWAHSNMIGWGEKLDNYREIDFSVAGDFSLVEDFEPISHRAGKELLLQITYNNKFLVRGKDYNLITLPDLPDYYAGIEFSDELNGKTVNIKQWYSRFKCQVPASLTKIGLAPVYRPEIYLDETYVDPAYFLVRHDGSKYYLSEGVAGTGYPNNLVEKLLYEYELAVWASISYDVENNDFKEIVQARPGYFRSTGYSYIKYNRNVVDETNSWLVENNIYDNANDKYNAADGFTLIYQLGSGDEPDTTLIGSWRLIYKYVFDTDRPHTHPWEMLGHTIKPLWWDNYYSWTDVDKRNDLEAALRKGRINSPAEPAVINPYFAKCNDKLTNQNFPVDASGNLLAPDHPSIMSWLEVIALDDSANWSLGYLGPYEQVFAGTHRNLAAVTRTMYMQNPVLYVNQNWVPGQQIKNAWGHYVDRTTNFWQQAKIEHSYHRSVVNEENVYTAGIESLYGEFCVLNNKDFKSEVIDKFNNVVVNKEFLLRGFTNKDNVKIQSTSINSQKQTLFVPEENYAVRTIKHYSSKEKFYSGMRIIFDGTNYSIYGFNKEYSYFSCYKPFTNSPNTPIIIGDVTVKEKTSYDRNYVYQISYGTSFSNRFDLYDIILGYGKYLEDQGFIFDQPEGGDIRDWQLSAKQFIFWSNDLLAPGNYIDLNPAADFLALNTQGGHLENLEGTNENAGQCVDRFNNPLFSKDLLVSRYGDDNRINIRTKNAARPLYGIKLTFSYYETVVHLDSTSVFDDIYFLPEQSTAKRSFVLSGKKTQDWTGEYFAPGYVFNNLTLVPNLDTMAEQGRSLIDVESVTIDPKVREAAKDQFGLTRNNDLQQLFLQEDSEVSFKTAITYNKGTVQVFNSLAPLTHKDDSTTSAYEEYMVRTGEFGNTKNIDYYEFELLTQDLEKDYRSTQVIKFIGDGEPEDNNRILYIKDNSTRWVHKPLHKNLRFNTTTRTYSKLKTGGPLLMGDTNYHVDKIEDIDNIYAAYVDLWSILHYDETASYKKYDRVRFDGKLYYAKTTVSPGAWSVNNDKFTEIPEPWLPNIYVNNYYKPNPDLGNNGLSIFTPGTWQVLQTIDRSIGIVETCPGPDDVSKVRITTNKVHGLKKGEYVVIVNCASDNNVVEGIWSVDSIGTEKQFFINTRITEVIKKGKIFPLKPVRFKNVQEFNLATQPFSGDYGYEWRKKFAPLTNVLGETNLELDPTPSGFDQTYPIAIIDDGLNLNRPEATFDYGNYKVYSLNGINATLIKEESLPVDSSDIEHLIIYDYSANQTLAKLELYDPKKLQIPQVFKDDIDHISRVDPAKYNRTTDEYKSVYTSLGWYEEFVGTRWWNTSAISFADYESGNDLTRSKQWGSVLGGTVDIYEWTKSPVPPDQWYRLVQNKSMVNGQVASGEAYVDKSLNTENYHWVQEQDYASGDVYNIYYFWVKNKNTISKDSQRVRVYSTKQLSSYILNPTAAGLAWWAPISNNAIILKGVDSYLNSSSTVVQIKKKTKGNEKHQQWTFISEGNIVESIPEWVHVRFRDSISAHIFYKIIGSYTSFSAVDSYKQSDIVKYNNKFYICRINMPVATGFFDIYNSITNPNGVWAELKNVFEVTGSLIGTWDGYFWDKIYWDYSLDKFWFWKARSVPDQVNLHRYNRLGNNVRPYIQSWFNNVLEARRTLIKKLNQIMVNVDITTIPNWSDIRLNKSNFKVADETVDVTAYWKFVDFQSENYNSTKEISTVLDNEGEIYTAGIDIGEYVKINTGVKDYVIYEKNSDQSFNVVYRTKGAIEFDKILYDPVSLSSYDVRGHDKYSWDFDLNSAFNIIIDALRYEIFVGKYSKYYSSMICTMFRYVLSEQVNVDWLAKSSTVEPVNLIGKNLTAIDSLKRDEITVLTNFYNSVKSYRDKIRGGTVNKTAADETVIEFTEKLKVKEFDSDGILIDTLNIF